MTVAMLAACADVRTGTARMPMGAVNIDNFILEAIRHSLSAPEQKCPLELVRRDRIDDGAMTPDKHVESVMLCGHLKAFSIQRSQKDADTVLIIAKPI
jgi:hypothetical protein